MMHIQFGNPRDTLAIPVSFSNDLNNNDNSLFGIEQFQAKTRKAGLGFL